MNSAKIKKITALLRRYGMVLVLILVFAAGAALSPSFLTGRNMLNVCRQISVYCILAFGMTILLIVGVNDLSMGATLALAGYMGCLAFNLSDSLPLALIISILIGMLVGFLNALCITKLHLPPFIATMAMDMAVRGFLYVYSSGIPIYNIGDVNLLSVHSLFGFLPTPLFITLIVFVVTAFILHKTTLGRKIYAVGGNPEAARASGISITKTRVIAFLISGAFVGIAGILLAARINSALPNAGEGYHADAIAAAVLGGTAFGGGTGTAVGTFVGGVIIGLLNNILNLCGVNSYYQQIVRGLVIIAAVAYDISSKNKKQKNQKIIPKTGLSRFKPAKNKQYKSYKEET